MNAGGTCDNGDGVVVVTFGVTKAREYGVHTMMI